MYLGVGPEQNFTYIVGLRPKLAFIVDIRRGNLLEQLLYKAFVEMSSTRAEFLSRLFARKRPVDLAGQCAGRDDVRGVRRRGAERGAVQGKSPGGQGPARQDHKFTLSADDLKALEYVYSAFFRGGPDRELLLFTERRRPGFGVGFPSYAELMTETDGQGEQRSYLATRRELPGPA